MIPHCNRSESHGKTLFTFPMPGEPRAIRVLTLYPFKERPQFEVAKIEADLNYYLSKMDTPEWEKLKWKILELFPKSKRLRQLECLQERAADGEITGETLVSKLLDDYLTEYKKEHPKTAHKIAPHIKPVREFFDSELFEGEPAKVKDLTEKNIKKFRAYRRDTPSEKTGKPVARATINKNLICISGALQFAGLPVPEKLGLYDVVNEFPNVRTGFYNEDECDAFVRHMPDWARNIVRFEFLLGWRISDTLSRKMGEHVDLREGVLKVLPGEGKKNCPRTIYLNKWPALKEVILDQIRRFPSTTFLFHRDGNQIPYNTFWDNWAKARKLVNEERTKAGLPPFELGKNGLEHDFRRTAARNIYRMLKDPFRTNHIIGWKPSSQMLVRYNIITDEDIKDAIEKIGQIPTQNYPKNTQTWRVSGEKSAEMLGNSD